MRDLPQRVYACRATVQALKLCLQMWEGVRIAKKEILHWDRQMQCSLYENEKPMNVTGGP